MGERGADHTEHPTDDAYKKSVLEYRVVEELLVQEARRVHGVVIAVVTLTVARVSDARRKVVATIVNYACHPTTLAWDNALISPDFVGRSDGEADGEGGAAVDQGDRIQEA